MRKGAARNMQRISLKVTFGVASPLAGGEKQPPVFVQMQRSERQRLDRFRHVFELEQEIQITLEKGGNVGLLRERLAGVLNGSIEPPRYRESRPTPMSVKAPDPRKRRQHQHRVYRTDREVAADIGDLQKGKLTLTGVATVKGLLSRFDEHFVASTLKIDEGLIAKIKGSAVFGLAKDLAAADGLLLVEVLERLAPTEDVSESIDGPPVEPGEETSPQFR